MKKFDAEKYFLQNGSFVNLDIFRLVLNELIHEKTCFLHILWLLYSDFIFFIDHYCAGGQISIAYCLCFI